MPRIMRHRASEDAAGHAGQRYLLPRQYDFSVTLECPYTSLAPVIHGVLTADALVETVGDVVRGWEGWPAGAAGLRFSGFLESWLGGWVRPVVGWPRCGRRPRRGR